MEKITKRKDGRYCINVYIGKDEIGRDIRKSVYGKTKKEVKEKAFQLKLKTSQGIDVTLGKLSFNSWADAWLNKQEKKAEQKDNYDYYKITKGRLKVITKYFGNTPIDKITPNDCEDFLLEIAKSNPITGKPSADKTIKEYYFILRHIFDFCIKNRVLVFNPTNSIDRPKGTKTAERKPLTDKEIKYFIETPHELQLACLIAIGCGLRMGEILALNENDIIIGETREISISKSANMRDGGKIKTPKTDAGIRTVPMPDMIYNALLNRTDKSFLVVNRNGKPFTKGQFEKSFNNYIKTINEKYDVELKTTMHCLRHTYCTLLYDAGVDIESASFYMGHKDIITTQKIYTHLRESRKEKSGKDLNEYFKSIGM